MFINLKRIRQEHGKTQEQVARDLDIPIGTYRGWEQLRNNPETSNAIRLAEYFDTTIDELLGRDVAAIKQAMLDDFMATAFKDAMFASEATLPVMTAEAPLYGVIAAGVPLEMIECERKVPIPDVFARGSKEYFYLEVRGDSMNKQILNGDYALIERSEVANNGDIVAVIINGCDATLKFYYKTDNSVILAPSSYSSEFEDLIFRDGDEDNPDITILGIMVWKVGPLKAY